MNKTGVGVAAVLAVLGITSSLVIGQNSPYSSLANGKFMVTEQGMTVSIPTTKDFESKTVVKNKGKGEVSSELLSIKYKHFDQEKNLLIRKVNTDQGDVLIAEPGTVTPELFASPDMNYYIFEEYDAVFLLNAKTLDIKLLTKDTVGELDRENLKAENPSMFWAINPKWSQDSKYVAYFSNRSNPNKNSSEIWVADIKTGEEKKIFESDSSIKMLGWDYKGHIIVEDLDTNTIEQVSLDGSIKKTLLAGVDVIEVNKQGTTILFSPTRPYTELWVLDLYTDKKIKLDTTTDTYFEPTFHFSPSGNKIVGLEIVGLMGERMIHIYDINEKTKKSSEGPKGYQVANTPLWIDEETILVNSVNDQEEYYAWMLDLTELKVNEKQ